MVDTGVDRSGCGAISEEDFQFALAQCSELLLDKNYELL